MTRILLCCGAGMSTSLLASKMQEVADKKGLKDTKIDAIALSEINNEAGKASIILLGPQVRFQKASLEKKVSVPVMVIDTVDYGMMNGEKVLNSALEVLK